MSIRKMVLFLVVGALSLGVSGCVSNAKYNKNTNLMRSQLQLLQTDIDSLRTGQQKVEDNLLEVSKTSSSSAVISDTKEIYRTPSGFTLASRDIQAALKNSGYYNGPVDGKIGPLTKTSLKRFQEDNGLVPDGVCGRNTWDKLNAFLQSPSRVK